MNMPMKSPFPGVDPYLEQYWGDIHTRLMVYLSDQIDEQLPGDLQARVEESVSVDLDESSRWVYPDVNVVEPRDVELNPAPAAIALATVAEPCIIPLLDEQITERRIEIVDLKSGNRVVTAIELLSPVNKNEEKGRQGYRRKQLDYIQGCVNLVEIDLIRSGEFVLAAPEFRIPRDQRSPYLVCVRRANCPNQAEIIHIPLDQPVPNFRIPLRATDPDVVVQLQPLLEDCYRRGRYGSIDYSKPPRPNLDTSDWDWALKLLKNRHRAHQQFEEGD
jgi:hypothetical protein